MINVKWRFGIIAGIFVAVFTLYPQFKMIYLRGSDWQGNYAYNDIDEVAYASYLRALIDGRPRKNDPYTGRDDTPENPQPESLFSIQFAAPYSVAIPARIFGIGAPWAMTLAGMFAGFFVALAVFWVIAQLTNNSWFAMMGSLVVIAGGALAAGEGAIGEISGWSYAYPYFPGLRRYIPAMAFPVFFILCGLIWEVLKNSELNTRILYSVLACFSFAFMVFSYFYIWTTAAAWLFCLVVVWILVRPEGFWKDFKAFIAIGIGCVFSLIPYAILLSKRTESMDNVQLLVYTHAPDFHRFPVYLSLFVIVLLIAGILFKLVDLKDRTTLFAASFALTVIAVFNQQIITGHSLQPIHYQVFIGNYVAGLALIVTIGILLQNLLLRNSITSKIVISSIALLAIVWGFVECHYTVRVLDDANIVRDKGMPLAKRLEELAKDDPNPHQTTILSFSLIQSDDSPTVAPQNVLWSRHQHVFAGLSWQESKERYYQYLYYENVDEKSLANRLKNGDFFSMIALFGWGRHSNRLSSEAKPLTYREIDEEAQKYKEYCDNFSINQAANPMISYVVVPQDWQGNLENLDRWYDRDNGENLGEFVLYRAKLKSENQK
jgi:hypothetical protein